MNKKIDYQMGNIPPQVNLIEHMGICIDLNTNPSCETVKKALSILLILQVEAALLIDFHREYDEYLYEEEHGKKVWRKDGVIHRDFDRPAIIDKFGKKEWFLHGVRNRINDQPTIEFGSGVLHWHKDSVLHRDNGPAITYPNDNGELYYKNGQKHRDALGDDNQVLPAHVGNYGRTKEFWYDGKQYDKTTLTLMIYKMRNIEYAQDSVDSEKYTVIKHELCVFDTEFSRVEDTNVIYEEAPPEEFIPTRTIQDRIYDNKRKREDDKGGEKRFKSDSQFHDYKGKAQYDPNRTRNHQYSPHGYKMFKTGGRGGGRRKR